MNITGYVVFQDSDKRLLRPLKKGFRHCLVAFRGERLWTIQEMGQSHAHTDYEFVDDYCTILDLYRDDVIIRVDSFIENKIRVRFGIYTCVSHVCSYLGINPFLFTPYQLYNYLLRRGHERLT